MRGYHRDTRCRPRNCVCRQTDGPLHRRGDYINSRRPSLLRSGALTIARPSVLSQRQFGSHNQAVFSRRESERGREGERRDIYQRTERSMIPFRPAARTCSLCAATMCHASVMGKRRIAFLRVPSFVEARSSAKNAKQGNPLWENGLARARTPSPQLADARKTADSVHESASMPAIDDGQPRTVR